MTGSDGTWNARADVKIIATENPGMFDVIGRCLLEERQLVVVGGKGGKDRVIPMSERTMSSLADLVLTDAIEANHFLWYGQRGNQLG